MKQKILNWLFQALYPLEYPLLLLVHIIYGAWAVGLLAFFGLVPNEKNSYFMGIPVVVFLLFFFFKNPHKKRKPVQNTPPLGTLPDMPPPANFPSDPGAVYPNYPSSTTQKGGSQ